MNKHLGSNEKNSLRLKEVINNEYEIKVNYFLNEIELKMTVFTSKFI